MTQGQTEKLPDDKKEVGRIFKSPDRLARDIDL